MQVPALLETYLLHPIQCTHFFQSGSIHTFYYWPKLGDKI
jgi:hypothetical protein